MGTRDACAPQIRSPRQTSGHVFPDLRQLSIALYLYKYRTKSRVAGRSVAEQRRGERATVTAVTVFGKQVAYCQQRGLQTTVSRGLRLCRTRHGD